MQRKLGGLPGNSRTSQGLGLVALALLWIWKLSSPTSLSPALRDSFQPRLNTTWHEQIALELATNETALKAVQTPHGVLDRTRVALLIENRPLPYLIPLLVHFIAVVPPEWSFRFMGSPESIAMMGANPTIQRHVESKKLFLDLIPYDIVSNVETYETMNHLLSRAWLYEEWLWPAEWVFLFQDDSMVCSASSRTVNDFVDEGWSFLGVSGAASSKPGHATGGGFSLRYVPHLVKLLRTYSFDDWAKAGRVASEDYYFSMALWDMPEARMPTGANEAIRWAMVNEWAEDPEEMPLGFHAFSSDGMFRGPGGQENQNKAYAYCPELAIISVGRWDCQCSPSKQKPGGLGD